MDALKKEDFNHTSNQSGGTFKHKSNGKEFKWSIIDNSVHIHAPGGSRCIQNSCNVLNTLDDQSRKAKAKEIALEAIIDNPEFYLTPIPVNQS